jgi:hypothetical protein
LSLLLKEEIGSLAAYFVISENVGFKINVIFCLGNSFEHSFICGRAINQQFCSISRCQRTTAYGLHKRYMFLQELG